MNKKQAYDLLVQATNLLKLTREEHQAIVQALDVLKPEDQVEEKKE